MEKSTERCIESRIEAVVRILCDVRPQGAADAAYLFAQTADNESSVIDAAKKIIDDSVASRILLLRTRRVQGYPGFDAWKGRLVGLGIPETLIIPVDLSPADSHNTLTEAGALVRFAKQQRYGAIVVSAAPFHQVRAFMTVVRGAFSEFPELKIYSLPGIALPWTERAVHSQGVLRAKRAELVRQELERIDDYCRKGDLIPFDAVIDYLNQRDARPRPILSPNCGGEGRVRGNETSAVVRHDEQE